jgi:histidine triad (HIT) family protein
MTDCIFCKIANGTILVKAVYEDEACLAFVDVNPVAPTHLLVVPRQHFVDVETAPTELLGQLLNAASTVGQRELPGGHRIVINTGGDGGQTVHHLHLHLLGGRHMHWPPG